MKERRLLKFRSNLEEWTNRFGRDYVNLHGSKRNPVDHVTHAVGGAMSVLLEGPDLLIESVARAIDGKTRPVNPLRGDLARFRRDVGDVFKGPGIFSRIAAAIRLPGDILMDGIDLGIGNHHP